jgi:hypothetical protein
MYSWSVVYDSAGAERSFAEIRVRADANCSVLLDHTNFLTSQSVESPDAVYEKYSSGLPVNVPQTKRYNLFFTKVNPNKLTVKFDNGSVVSFNITDQTHIGGYWGEPRSTQWRTDLKSATDFFKLYYGQTQQRRDQPLEPGGRRWLYGIHGMQ